MGMYGDVSAKLDTGLIIKLDPGKLVRVRLLDHAWIAQPQFDDGVAVQYFWPVWDYTQSRPRVLRAGKSIFDQLGGVIEMWDGDGYELPSPFDLKIMRTGTGQQDTKYQVNGVPQIGTMPPSNTINAPDMTDVAYGHAIPMARVLDGETPPIYLPKTGEIVAGSDVLPAAGSTAALVSDQGRQRDVIPTVDDVDTDNPINLDDLPF